MRKLETKYYMNSNNLGDREIGVCDTSTKNPINQPRLINDQVQTVYSWFNSIPVWTREKC